MIVSHPFGSPNSYEVAAALRQNGLLKRFLTCIYSPLGANVRMHPELDGNVVLQHPLRELLRLGLASIRPVRGLGRSTPFVDWVARDFDRWVANRKYREVRGVWVYEDFGLMTARKAHAAGVPVIYDLPTVYHPEARSIADQAARMCPAVAPFLRSHQEPPERIARKCEELQLADIVVCASSFVKHSLISHGVPEKRIRVVPYGADCSVPGREWTQGDFDGPTKLLFVGALSPHKGLHHLFAALENLPSSSYSLTLAGSWVPGFQQWLAERYKVRFHHAGQVPHNRMLHLYREHHVLVFPALQDGFGLVLLEAMAAGLPVIASNHSGAPDIVTAGANGYVFEAGNIDELRTMVERVTVNRNWLPFAGRAARQTAEECSWTKYRAAVTKVVGEAIRL